MKSKDEGFWELGVFGLSWRFSWTWREAKAYFACAWVDQCIYSSLFSYMIPFMLHHTHEYPITPRGMTDIYEEDTS